MSTLEKRMGRCRATQTKTTDLNQPPHCSSDLSINFGGGSVEISTTKFCRALNGTLLGAAGGILFHAFVVVTAALIRGFA